MIEIESLSEFVGRHRPVCRTCGVVHHKDEKCRCTEMEWAPMLTPPPAEELETEYRRYLALVEQEEGA